MLLQKPFVKKIRPCLCRSNPDLKRLHFNLSSLGRVLHQRRVPGPLPHAGVFRVRQWRTAGEVRGGGRGGGRHPHLRELPQETRGHQLHRNTQGKVRPITGNPTSVFCYDYTRNTVLNPLPAPLPATAFAASTSACAPPTCSSCSRPIWSGASPERRAPSPPAPPRPTSGSGTRSSYCSTVSAIYGTVYYTCLGIFTNLKADCMSVGRVLIRAVAPLLRMLGAFFPKKKTEMEIVVMTNALSIQ